MSMPCSETGSIVKLEGGVASNAVPGEAYAIVRADVSELPATASLTMEEVGEGLVRIDASGKSAHASTPESGVSAIGLIVDYLLAHDVCDDAERAFLQFDQRLIAHTDGSGLGIACEDEHFGALTAVGGTIRTEEGCFVQSIDIRFPTSISAAQLTERIRLAAEEAGATYREGRQEEPFLMDPNSPVIQALLSAYNEATGEQAEAFTMGGGTYARHFSNAASFGPEKSWEEAPAWVGSMHRSRRRRKRAAAQRRVPHLRTYAGQADGAVFLGARKAFVEAFPSQLLCRGSAIRVPCRRTGKALLPRVAARLLF